MARLSEVERELYATEMATARSVSDIDARWKHLERAHIISQPSPWLHTCNHVAMFALAIRQHDRKEALGQAIRIAVAAPGSLVRRYPEGNTGRTAAGLLTPMSMPGDLAQVLEPYRTVVR